MARWTWMKVLRRPVVLSFSFLQPLLWLVFFGFLFQRYDPGGARYFDFLVPGVCAMTVLFGASQSGVTFIRDMQTGFFERLLATPTPVGVIVAAKVGADAARLVAQAAGVLLLAITLGADVRFVPGPMAAALAALFAFGLLFSALSCLLAFRARVPEVMATYVHVVNMPLLFTSTALVPRADMPSWLGAVAAFNPLTLAVDVVREALLAGAVHAGAAATILGLLASAAVVGAGASAAARP